MSLSPAAAASDPPRTLLHACLDLGVLLAASITFACVLTAQVQTEHLGWAWPSMPYDYTRGDVWIHALLASLVVIPVLVLCRHAGARPPSRWQDLAFAVATLVVIRLGRPMHRCSAPPGPHGRSRPGCSCCNGRSWCR